MSALKMKRDVPCPQCGRWPTILRRHFDGSIASIWHPNCEDAPPASAEPPMGLAHGEEFPNPDRLTPPSVPVTGGEREKQEKAEALADQFAALKMEDVRREYAVGGLIRQWRRIGALPVPGDTWKDFEGDGLTWHHMLRNTRYETRVLYTAPTDSQGRRTRDHPGYESRAKDYPEATLYVRRCGWCGVAQGTVSDSEICSNASSECEQECPHQFGHYEVYTASPPDSVLRDGQIGHERNGWHAALEWERLGPGEQGDDEGFAEWVARTALGENE